MQSKKIGKQTVRVENPVSLAAGAAVGGKVEGEGPMSAYFDYINNDTYFGQDNWEHAEIAMLGMCFDLTLQKVGLKPSELDYIFSGDLLNQCISSAFAVKDSGVPYFGLYGACSTMAESLSLAALCIDGGFAKRVCALTSSHFCSSERQYRMPLPYGCQRTPTAQRTATAAGAVVITDEEKPPYVTRITTGRIVDGGITDAANMGAAMAPAALETLCTHFEETGRDTDYYDAVVTGDLGSLGSEILLELAADKGFDLSAVHRDCGVMLFDARAQNVKSGGSGCGCCAGVLAGYFLPELKAGRLKRILFAATGAITSPTTAMQGSSILGICHALAIENER